MDKAEKASLRHDLISAIIPVLLGFFIGYYSGVQPDFGISVQPIAMTIPIGSATTANITAFNIHSWPHNYQNQIILTATASPNYRNSSDLNISFDQVGFDPFIDHFPFRSKMKVYAGQNTKPGEYKLDILGIGGDGKEKRCTFLLYIRGNDISDLTN
jgi:hypothetical protein